MKKLFFTLAAVLFAACATDVTEDVAIGTPETIEVSFEEDSRIQLQNGKTVWTKGDLVSVFYKSDANQKWQFQGNTGDRTGTIKRVSAGSATRTMDKVVVAYPYSDNYLLNLTTGDIEATLPATQHYLKDSYGLDGNIMVSSSYFTQVSLKNVCGWLKLQLTGNGESVKSIAIKGNNGEQVAGLIYVNTENATSILASEMGKADENENGVGGSLFFDDTIVTEVTLDCGNSVTLGKNATAFYIALPPQEFSKGLTAVIECADGSIMTKETSNTLEIERNAIQPMAALEFERTQPFNNEIWYTSSDGEIVEPNKTEAFGVKIKSNTYENGNGIITFEGNISSIGDNAFSDCSSLTSITIPDSVTSIGSFAFVYCSSLTSITIPDSVTSIGEYAFDGCSSLTAFYGKFASADNRCLIIDGVLRFFAPKGLTEYTIPDSVTSIGYSAFEYCSSLESITIPDSVTLIGNSAFFSCRSLTSITIPDSVTLIGNYAFFSCDSLTSVAIPDSVTKIGYSAFEYCSSLTSVTIPDSVTSIGERAFIYCSSLKKVYCYATIPPSLGNNAFYGNAIGRRIYVYEECVELYKSAWSSYKDSIYSNGKNCPDTTIIEYTTNDGNIITSSKLPIISNSYENGVGTLVVGKIAQIPSFAFDSCSSLTSITIPDSVTSIERNAFGYCDSLTSVTIPNSVTSIGYKVFYSCSSLTSVTIGNSVTSIGDSAFYDCSSLESITIPNSVTSIGYKVFYSCSSLTSITIPDSVTSIGYNAFESCNSLTSVTIGNSVTSIGENVFYDCSSLKEVYCKPTTPPSGGSGMFTLNASGRKIYVPRASVDAYKTASYWSDYATDIEPYDF